MDDGMTTAVPDEVQAETGSQAPPDDVRLDTQDQAFDDSDPLRVAATTLSGDLRDFILNLLDAHRSDKPMKRRPQREQEKIIAEVTARVNEAVEEAVRIISTSGAATITGTLDSVNFKGAAKLTITASKNDPIAPQLIKAQGGDVMVALIDSRRFMGERAPAIVTPDQSDIEQYAQEVNEANDAARGDDEVHLVPPEDVPGAMDGAEGETSDLETVAGGEVGFGDHVEDDEAEDEAGEDDADAAPDASKVFANMGGAEPPTYTAREQKRARAARAVPKATGPKPSGRGRRATAH